MNEKREYCPRCKLPLNGDNHKNESEAWDIHGCDYNKVIDSGEQPITEIEMLNIRLVKAKKWRRDAGKAVKYVEKLIAEIKSE